MNRPRFWTTVLLLLMLTGCSSGTGRTRNSPPPAPLPAASGGDAIRPQEAYPQIKFSPVSWLVGTPGTPAGTGVWVYTDRDQLPDAGISWKQYDLLLLKIPGDAEDEKRLKIDSLQVISADVVRIVVKTEASEQKVASTSVAWITVPDGSLAGKRFVVVDPEYEILNLDPVPDPAVAQVQAAKPPNRTYPLISFDRVTWLVGKPVQPEAAVSGSIRTRSSCQMQV